jgi:hypothetical protein
MSKVIAPTVLVIFGDGLESIKFVQDGNVVDPRVMLRALAAGAYRVTYSEKRHEQHEHYLLSQTFALEPTNSV